MLADGVAAPRPLLEQRVAEAWNLLVAPYSEALGMAVAAVLTLAVFSYLLGDNALYKLAEHIFVGVSVGYSAIVAYHSVLYPKLLAPLLESPQANAILVIPLLLCLMLLAYAVPRLRPLASIPLAVVIGVGAALSIGGAVTGIIIPQVQASMLPLNAGVPLDRLLNNAIIVVAAISTLFYFHFTAGGRGASNRAIRTAGAVGKWFMLVAFGALFGSVFMSRITLLIGRVQFLLVDWLHLAR